MCLDLLPESIAQADDVAIRLDVVQIFITTASAPDPEPVKEMEPPIIPKLLAPRAGFASEIHRARKDPLESVDQSPIMGTVFWQIELLQYFSGRAEQHSPALLTNRKCGDPDWDKAVLPEWKA